MHSKRYQPVEVIVIVVLLTFSILGCSVGRRIVKGPATATATATATRRPTFTPSPTPTYDPFATPTPGGAPVATSAPSKPVAAPAGTAQASVFSGVVSDGLADCSSTGVFGFVRDREQQNIQDAFIRVWADDWRGRWAQSQAETFGDGDRNYEIRVDDKVTAGSFHVALVKDIDSEESVSPVIDVITTDSCEGTGAVQWARVDFTKGS